MKAVKLVLTDAGGNSLGTVCYLPASVAQGLKIDRSEADFILGQIEAAVRYTEEQKEQNNAT